jgi:CRP/FNR family transcriptional regulator, cyclic AMP receptor protein
MLANGILHCSQNSADGESSKSDPVWKSLARRDLVELKARSLPVFFSKGSMFFLEGQSATGIFLLRTGRAKESMVSSSGRTAIVRVVVPGVILGLAGVLTGAPHESTVEALEPSRADFLRKPDLLHLLRTSGPLGQVVASQLSRNCKEAYASVRCLGLSSTVSEKFARLVLHWAAECPLANHDKDTANVRIRVLLTHEEIAQAMGTTRETTSRTLRKFRDMEWITTKGCIWTITNEGAIRHLAAL